MESLKLLSQIALTFIKSDNFDFKIKNSLDKIGNYFKVSRIYIFLDNEDGTTTSNIYEWCNDGIIPQINELQDIPYESVPSWKNFFLKEGDIYYENVEDLPSDIADILTPQRILSIIVKPLYIGGGKYGFIGFDECEEKQKWSEKDKRLLETILNIIAAAYKDHFFQKKINAENNNFESLFNTIEDLVVIADKQQGKILYANDAVTNKLGYSSKELYKMNMTELHPLEKREEADNFFKLRPFHDENYCSIELQSKNKEYISVETRIWLGKWDNQECLFCLSKDLREEQEALQKFVKLFENNPVLMIISDLKNRKVMKINRAVIDKLGYSRDELIGKKNKELKIIIDSKKQQQIIKKLNISGRVKDFEVQVRCKDGNILDGLLSGQIIEIQGKKFSLIVIADISEQILLTKKIEEQKNKLQNVIEGSRLGTWEWELKSGEFVVNERFTEIFGYTKEELMPIHIETWIRHTHLEDLKKSYDSLKRHFSKVSKYYSAEFRMKHKNGDWMWVLSKGKVIEWDEEGQPVKMFGTHSDITEKKQLEEKIKEISIRDPLTNIYNRRYIFKQLEFLFLEFIRTERNFTVSIIDIDYFKSVNDRYGHQAGDFTLREFAQIIKKNIRPYDLFGRYGGEEFIIISKNISKDETILTIERILDIIRDHEFIYYENKIRLAFSCGISECKEIEKDKISVEKIIEKADERLYMAKNNGRNRVVNSD
ncbi:diguanylate cyclase [Fusobacteria bacterium ZRK30]|nr:diguanylate cyclase [Fusobacteria bacterium ZRK30]